MTARKDPNTPRSVVITGGAGFVGSHLVKRMLESSGSVTVVDNLHTGRTDLLPTGAATVSFIEADVRDAKAVHDAFARARPDIVVHLAALHYIPYCDANPVETVEVNVNGTRNILAGCADYPPVKFLFASTAAVYPARDCANSEDSEVGPLDIYGNSKLVGEELCELFHRRTGVPTVVARLFNVFGPNETNAHLIPEVTRQLASGIRQLSIGNLEPRRDFVHVDDVCRAIQILVGSTTDGYHVFNVGSGVQHSVREVIAAVQKVSGLDISIAQEPKRVRASDRPHLLADISKIRAETGWEPQISLVDGLQELVTDL